MPRLLQHNQVEMISIPTKNPLLQLDLDLDSDLQELENDSRVNFTALVPLKKPWMTFVLGTLMILCFLWSFYLAEWSFESFSSNPMIGPDVHALDRAGAKITHKVLQGEWFRLVIPTFLHAGLLHLIPNLVVFLSLAYSMESEYGAFKLVFVFLFSGISSFVLSAIMLPQIVSVGASGAILGIIGALYPDMLHNLDFQPDSRKTCIKLSLLILFVLVTGLVPLVDNFVHIGGLIGGILSGLLVLGHSSVYSRLRKQKKRIIVNLLSSVLTIVWIACLSFLLFNQRARNAALECQSCQLVNCIPSPFWTCTTSGCTDTSENGTVIGVSLSECGL
jgi:membrane associated rhomboid family serine protease